MPSPFDGFLAEARRLTNLVRDAGPVEDHRLLDFLANQKRLDFLQDLINRVAVLGFCYESLCRLTDELNALRAHIEALPVEPGRPNLRRVPPELLAEDETRMVEADGLTSLVYYEVTNIVGMLRQVGVAIDPASEIQYMAKVRDRFLAHVRLSGVARGARHGHALPEQGFLRRDVVSLNTWSQEDLRALGERALRVGSPEWEAQRRRNEALVLSKKRNEDFSRDELIGLMAAGVRECKPELALEQLAVLVQQQLLPVTEREANTAIEAFGWERWPSGEVFSLRLWP